jgi:hypothetical protein
MARHTDNTKLPILPKTSWIKICVIPIAMLYLYTGQRSVQDIISFVISLFAILSNMLAHTFMRQAQRAKTPEHSKLAALFASVCFAVSASVFLTLNLYASYYSRRYLFAQLVPQSVNACLAITRVFNMVSDLFKRCLMSSRIRRIIRYLSRHPCLVWGCRKQEVMYTYFSQGVIYCLQRGHQYMLKLRQQYSIQNLCDAFDVSKIQRRCVDIIEPKVTLIREKYTPRRKFEQYFLPGDIARFIMVCLAASLLSDIDHNFNIFNILFSLSLCTFAASQTIERRHKPARADTYQLLHLYASRLLAVCSGMLYFFDRRGLNATKNAAYAILNVLVQKIISETRKREKQ